MRLLTERVGGGVLDPLSEANGKDGPLGKNVFEALQDKHLAQCPAESSAFLHCNDLPSLENVDITAVHIETVAKCLSGTAGLSGTDSEQWRSFLLRYSSVSARLCESICLFYTCHHANEVVPWTDMRAFLARRSIAINNQPGVHPIGVGECRQ